MEDYNGVQREFTGRFVAHRNPLETARDSIVSSREDCARRSDAQRRKRVLEEIEAVRAATPKDQTIFMSAPSVIYKYPGEPQTYELLRRHNNFGIEELDLLQPPGRLWAWNEPAPLDAEMHVDTQHVQAVHTSAELLAAGPGDDWMAMTRRILARLAA